MSEKSSSGTLTQIKLTKAYIKQVQDKFLGLQPICLKIF